MSWTTGLWRRTPRKRRPVRARLEVELLEARTLLSTTLGLTPLVPVSKTDPITNNADLAVGQRGTVYLNSQVEPQVAVDPGNPKNAVAVWQQDRWSSGGARALAASVSTDGGATWGASVVIPGFSLASGNPDYLRASDPWVSIGPDHTVYVTGLAATLGPAIPVPSKSAVVALTGTFDSASPGGIDWSTPHTLIANSSPFPLDRMNDKESITADPHKAGYAYAVWDQLDFPTDQAGFDAYHAGAAIRENLYFSMTRDGGATWTAARNVTNFQKLNSAFGNQLVVEPDGTLVDVCTIFNGSGNQAPQAGQVTLAVIRSTDGGNTWSGPITGPAEESVAISDPDTGQPVRDGESLVDVRADPHNGNLYAVWADGRFSNFAHEDIAFSMSTNGGLTWSAPIKVNQTPTTVPAGDQQAFTPSVAVADDGTVAVTYYDFRNNTAAAGVPTDYWLVHAAGNFTDPASWQGDEKRLTDTSFDMANAPGHSLFLGDYQGLAAAGNSFYALFAQAGQTAGTSGMWFRDPPPAGGDAGAAPGAASAQPPASGGPSGNLALPAGATSGTAGQGQAPDGSGLAPAPVLAATQTNGSPDGLAADPGNSVSSEGLGGDGVGRTPGSAGGGWLGVLPTPNRMRRHEPDGE